MIKQCFTGLNKVGDRGRGVKAPGCMLKRATVCRPVFFGIKTYLCRHTHINVLPSVLEFG